MAERDLERAEVAKATSHVGEVEQELSMLREGQEQVRPVLTTRGIRHLKHRHDY